MCTSMLEFVTKGKGAYSAAWKNGWLKYVDLPRLSKKRGYWSKANCALEACRYSQRSAFNKGSTSAYCAALREGWLDSICQHMTPGWGADKDRPRYVYVISTKTQTEQPIVYVGLAMDVVSRINSHRSKRGKKSVRSLLNLKNVVVTVMNKGKALPELRAAKLEKSLITRYRNKGYTVLNAEVTAGQLGGSPAVKWTQEAVLKEALRYSTRTNFWRGSSGAYCAAQRLKILDTCCAHMIGLKKPNGYWTKDLCATEALKYETRSEFRLHSGSAYGRSWRSGWLNDICLHMENA